MVPLSRLLDASRLSVRIAITNESRRTVIRLTCHILFPCFLYHSEFPTLLAMREIIASANIVRISPEPMAKLQRFSKSAKVLHLFFCIILNPFQFSAMSKITWPASSVGTCTNNKSSPSAAAPEYSLRRTSR